MIEQEYVECQEAIDFGDDREYQENQRDDFVRAHEEAITACEERIRELTEENDHLKKELISLEQQKTELENTL